MDKKGVWVIEEHDIRGHGLDTIESQLFGTLQDLSVRRPFLPGKTVAKNIASTSLPCAHRLKFRSTSPGALILHKC